MKKFVLLFIGLIICCLCQAQQQSIAPELSNKDAIDHLQKDIPRLMKEANVPGMSVALIRNGKMVWSGVYGVINNDTHKPVTKQSIFEANSLSKPVFGYAVMTLVDRGKIELDKPIYTYMDSGFFDKSCTDPRFKLVTTRMILSNKSGIGFSPEDSDNKFLINFNPGEKFQYSPPGFQVLAQVIEHITQMRLEDFMKQAILGPLHMDQSSYVWEPRYDSLRAYQHDWQGVTDTSLKKWKRGAACCSLQTNAEDYSKVVIAVMNGELVKKATWEEIMKPQINADPRFPNLFWGLGWGLEKTQSGECFWHWGDGGKSKDYITGNLSTKDGIVFFANSENGLSFAKEMLDDAIGGEHPGIAFLGYARYDSPSNLLLKAILANGATPALKDYLGKRKQKIEENDMNAVGYQLVSIKKLDDALAVFEQNTKDYPASFNTWDSLAEAYMGKGNKELAIKYYKKSLELNPNNTNAVTQLKKLE
ncbi:MAG TPA: serine hydrolase [Mucilaginibacter sp.]|jgi:CubicO group peptidase (beta-lactamase class C family)|nr:serine hydrolase [Mucilaginibacter sp.]